jgi:hypothetical protein
MTENEVNDYAARVEAMARKDSAVHGWGFFYYRPVGNGESYGRKQSAREFVQQVLANFQRQQPL